MFSRTSCLNLDLPVAGRLEFEIFLAMRIQHYISLLFLTFVLINTACNKDTPPCTDCGEDMLIEGEYAPQPYELNLTDWLIEPASPDDNPLTIDGVALGRMLFYDPILSSDSTQSCASCHQQQYAFAEPSALSTGVTGNLGTRSAMAIINLGYASNGLFWDGRSATLEAQALEPVENPIEMHEDWDNVEIKLRRHPSYPVAFRKAFGIDNKNKITRDLAAKAIAQFERTLISYQSKYDEIVWENNGWFSDSEERGKHLFFVEEAQEDEHPGCSHCHIAKYFTNNAYENNGLNASENLLDFPDLGRGPISGNIYDNGRFRVPTLRNIALTAPYMHDGRFETLEEVLDHYSSGGHPAENKNINITHFTMTDQMKQDIINFLHTLTDTTFINKEEFGNPFE